MFERDPRQLVAQPLDLEMLEIPHPFAKLADRTAQQAQRLGMAGQEIGMPAEISEDIAALRPGTSGEAARCLPALGRAGGQPRRATSNPAGTDGGGIGGGTRTDRPFKNPRIARPRHRPVQGRSGNGPASSEV